MAAPIKLKFSVPRNLTKAQMEAIYHALGLQPFSTLINMKEALCNYVTNNANKLQLDFYNNTLLRPCFSVEGKKVTTNFAASDKIQIFVENNTSQNSTRPSTQDKNQAQIPSRPSSRAASNMDNSTEIANLAKQVAEIRSIQDNMYHDLTILNADSNKHTEQLDKASEAISTTNGTVVILQESVSSITSCVEKLNVHEVSNKLDEALAFASKVNGVTRTSANLDGQAINRINHTLEFLDTSDHKRSVIVFNWPFNSMYLADGTAMV